MERSKTGRWKRREGRQEEENPTHAHTHTHRPAALPKHETELPKSSWQSLRDAVARARPTWCPSRWGPRDHPGAGTTLGRARRTLGRFRLPRARSPRAVPGPRAPSITHSRTSPSAFLHPPLALSPSQRLAKRSEGGGGEGGLEEKGRLADSLQAATATPSSRPSLRRPFPSSPRRNPPAPHTLHVDPQPPGQPLPQATLGQPSSSARGAAAARPPLRRRRSSVQGKRASPLPGRRSHRGTPARHSLAARPATRSPQRRGRAGSPGKGRTRRGRLRSARSHRPAGRRGAPGPGRCRRPRRAPELLCSRLAPQTPSLYPLCPHPRPKRQFAGDTWSAALRSSARCGE